MHTHDDPRDESLDRLVRSQEGVVARRQLGELGVTRSRLRRALEAQRWRAVGPHVILMSKGGLTRRQMRWARLLHAGPKAVCAGISALEEDEVEPGAVSIVQALNAYGEHFEHPGWQSIE